MGETIGTLIQGILPQLKLIQTLMETKSFTLETVMHQTQMNLLEHVITLAQDPVIHRMDMK